MRTDPLAINGAGFEEAPEQLKLEAGGVE